MKKKQILLIAFVLFLCTIRAQYFQDVGFPSLSNQVIRASYFDEETQTEYFGGTFVWELQGQWLPNIFKRQEGVIQPLGEGFNWTLEDPLDNPLCQIRSIVKYNDEIYVSGRIDYSGNTSIHGVAKWDGSEWSQVGDLDVIPYIQVVRDTLIAFGTFEVGDMNSLCYWNQALDEWLPFHNFPNFWLPGNSVNFVQDIIEFENEIYVGGNFQSTETGVVDLVKWTGNQWIAVDGICGGISGVIDLDIYDGKLVVAGLIGEIYCAASPGNGIATYDGTNWDDMQGGVNAQVNHVAIYDNMLFAAGSFTTTASSLSDNIARWDGTEWCGIHIDSIDNFNGGAIPFMATTGDALYITGPVYDINGQLLSQFVQFTDSVVCYISDIAENNPLRKEISFFPNPSSSFLRIEAAQPLEVRSIAIYNAIGQLTAQYATMPHEIDVRHWPNGCYNVVVKYDNEVVRTRVVVE
jgi:hypothetical protein